MRTTKVTSVTCMQDNRPGDRQSRVIASYAIAVSPASCYFVAYDDLDLRRIAESGQCFRFTALAQDEGAYRIIHQGECLVISPVDRTGQYRCNCSEETFQRIWRPYFDLNEDYTAIRSRISPESDPYLYAAMQAQSGIRILRQEPFETLISFIISQNRNIPAIRSSIELLCDMCGEERSSGGEVFRAFPKPEAISRMTEQDLQSCRLGYRVPYVLEAARAVADGRLDLQALTSADPDTALRELTSLYGVGTKVASCVALFGLHQLNVFPMDVWIRRVLQEHYPDGFPFDNYSPYCGVYQQYLFAHARND
ncbi:MAG: hypothetical protein IJ083_01165 [Clostridia bacterium]|nr:hypothetical protein [Clostridia bacterium]